MDTAASLIEDSLQDIVVQGSEQSLDPAEAQAAIRYMNRYMTQLAAGGVNLGYTIVTSLADPITIPDGALDGLRARLAIRLAPMFDVAVSFELKEAARDGEKVMYSLGVQLQEMQYPQTLPIGSGNEGFLVGDNSACPARTRGAPHGSGRAMETDRRPPVRRWTAR